MKITKNKGQNMDWEYKTFQITKVTQHEYDAWHSQARKQGFRTLSSFLRPILDKFKVNKGEEDRGEINISVCSYEGKHIKNLVNYGASPQVRKHVNDSIKRQQKGKK
jgi:hypothetical protein